MSTPEMRPPSQSGHFDCVNLVKGYTHSVLILHSQAAAIVPDHRPNDDWPERGHVTFNHYSTRYREGLDLVLKDIKADLPAGTKVSEETSYLRMTVFHSNHVPFSVFLSYSFQSLSSISFFSMFRSDQSLILIPRRSVSWGARVPASPPSPSPCSVSSNLPLAPS